MSDLGNLLSPDMNPIAGFVAVFLIGAGFLYALRKWEDSRHDKLRDIVIFTLQKDRIEDKARIVALEIALAKEQVNNQALWDKVEHIRLECHSDLAATRAMLK